MFIENLKKSKLFVGSICLRDSLYNNNKNKDLIEGVKRQPDEVIKTISVPHNINIWVLNVTAAISIYT